MNEDLVGGAWGGVKLTAIRKRQPLKSARLWHPVCGACRRQLRWVAGRGAHGFTCVGHDCPERHKLVEASSQRYPLSLSIEIALGVFGGNGSGKTELVAQLCIAVALGSNHPDVAEWIRANGVNPDLIPPKGGLVIASSLTTELSRLTLRDKIRKYLPPGYAWRNENSVPSEITFEGHEGKIVFKSNDQGREKYQGFPAALIVLDEEHDQDVYEECVNRLSRFRWLTSKGTMRSGYIVLSMTPLKGLTWVFDEFVDPDTREKDSRAVWLWGENNPHLDQAARSKAVSRKSLSEAQRAARDRGTFGNAEGLIYRAWRRDVHVIEPFRPNFKLPGWYAFEGIDFGDRNPFSYTLYAYDANDDRLYLIDEHYQAETLLSEHVRIIKEKRRHWGVDPDNVLTIADPAQAAQRRSLAFEHGISTAAAQKDVRDGIEVCQERLRYDAAVEPGFYAFSTCSAFIKEIEGYKWLERKVKTNQPEQPLKKDDHAMDGWRYVCVGIRSAGLT